MGDSRTPKDEHRAECGHFNIRPRDPEFAAPWYAV
eukprot:SAG11_NODE_12878_length_681_cov_1.695876_2_plen_34_part_01